jgi:hypothetical protein
LKFDTVLRSQFYNLQPCGLPHWNGQWHNKVAANQLVNATTSQFPNQGHQNNNVQVALETEFQPAQPPDYIACKTLEVNETVNQNVKLLVLENLSETTASQVRSAKS